VPGPFLHNTQYTAGGAVLPLSEADENKGATRAIEARTLMRAHLRKGRSSMDA